MELIKQPWPWYVAGPLIGLIVPTLLLPGNKTFGISGTLRQVCAACIPANISFFKYDWKKESWNLFFAAGIVVGGFIATCLLSDPGQVNINPHTTALLKQEGIKDFSGLLPRDVFSFSQLFTLRGFVLGWDITGACPGPLFAQIGSGFGVIMITLLSAIAGTWVYGLLREKLPH